MSRSAPPVVSLAAIRRSAVCSVSAHGDAAGSAAAGTGDSAVRAKVKIRDKIRGKIKPGTGKAGLRSPGFFVVAFMVAIVVIGLFKAVAGSWVRGAGDAGVI